MIPKALESISNEDLVSLSMPEGKQIEYKDRLPMFVLGASEAQRRRSTKGEATRELNESKREFLADVSSFANSVGGDLIFGIEEEEGVPTRVVGVGKVDTDQTSLSMEQLLQTSLEPRLPRCEIRFIPTDVGDHVLIVRIEQSWTSPHRVTLRGHDKFYARHSAGKYPLDVAELRDAFVGGTHVRERLREFLADRYARLQSDGAPASIRGQGIVAMHLLPLSAFRGPNTALDVAGIEPPFLPTIPERGGFDYRLNLDGLITTVGTSGDLVRGYTQLFRNGCFESVFGLENLSDDGKVEFRGTSITGKVIRLASNLIDYVSNLGVGVPLILFVRLVCPSGARMTTGWEDRDFQDPVCAGPTISLPETLFDVPQPNVPERLRPMLDVFWNAFGFPRAKY